MDFHHDSNLMVEIISKIEMLEYNAYKRGFENGQKFITDAVSELSKRNDEKDKHTQSCHTCRFRKVSFLSEPCIHCSNAHVDCDSDCYEYENAEKKMACVWCVHAEKAPYEIPCVYCRRIHKNLAPNDEFKEAKEVESCS